MHCDSYTQLLALLVNVSDARKHPKSATQAKEHTNVRHSS